MGDLESGGTGVGGSIYANNLKQFNDGLNNTTLAVNQFAAAYRDAKRIALDERATAQEKADAARQALLTEVSGFGSGIEGFANSYTNGVNHLNEVRHGFVRRNFMARNTKALSQKLEDLKSAFATRGGEVDPREVAANKLLKDIKPIGGQEELSAAASKVGDSVGEGDKVGSTAAERLANLASSAAGDEGEEVSAAAARDARRVARRSRLMGRLEDLRELFGAPRGPNGEIDTSGLPERQQRILRNAQDISDNVKSMNEQLGQPNVEQVAQNVAAPSGPSGGGPPVEEGVPREAAPLEEPELGPEPDVRLPAEAENAAEEAANIGSKAESAGKETSKVLEGLDEALPEVDAAEATTAEIPVVGEAVGAIGGLIQLGTAIAGAFGADKAPEPPEPETSEDVNFAPGQLGGDFSVSRSTA